MIQPGISLTYKALSKKILATAILFRKLMCDRSTVGMGRPMMAKSMSISTSSIMRKYTEKLKQCPSTVLSQKHLIGMQYKKELIIAATNQARQMAMVA